MKERTFFPGKRIGVVGLGASGVAAATLLSRLGAQVLAVDDAPFEKLSEAARALSGVRFSRDRRELLSQDGIVVSPGIPAFEEFELAKERNIPVVGEVELATSLLRVKAPIVAVGGTNGKSTTTMLVGTILKAAGLRTFVGGNLGEPLSAHADEAFDAMVLEVSSFQMERVVTFHPRVCVLLNVTDDHLDRYANFDAYAAAKGNAFQNQTEHDVAVIPANDEVTLRQARRGAAARVTFGPGADVEVTDEDIRDPAQNVVLTRKDLRLSGGHNALNVAAALASVRPFQIAREVVVSAVMGFEGLPHRTTRIACVSGVSFYDDSKGTNVGAAVTALLGLSEARAVLIAGGRDKGGSYAPLVEALSKKGRGLVLIGEAAQRIAEEAAGRVPVRFARTMEEAVRFAADLARPKDAVLLSPACSSFDMFRDYKHRGEVFVRAVRSLEKEASHDR